MLEEVTTNINMFLDGMGSFLIGLGVIVFLYITIVLMKESGILVLITDKLFEKYERKKESRRINSLFKKHATGNAEKYIQFRHVISTIGSIFGEDNPISKQSDFIHSKLQEDPKYFSPLIDEFEISFSLIVHVFEEAKLSNSHTNADVLIGIERIVTTVFERVSMLDRVISNTETSERETEVQVLLKQLNEELNAIQPKPL